MDLHQQKAAMPKRWNQTMLHMIVMTGDPYVALYLNRQGSHATSLFHCMLPAMCCVFSLHKLRMADPFTGPPCHLNRSLQAHLKWTSKPLSAG